MQWIKKNMLLMGILIVVIVGAFYITPDNYRPFIPPSETGEAAGSGMDQSLFSMLTGAAGSHYGLYGLLAGASIVFFAFIGFDVVATTAEETKDPQRDVAKGILASLAVVTVLYVAVSIVLSGMVPYTELKNGPDGKHANLATAFAANGVHWAATVISIGALAGLTTVVMVLVLGQTRVLFAMARDGLLPRQLAKTSSRGTPVRITVLVAVLVAVVSLFLQGQAEGRRMRAVMQNRDLAAVSGLSTRRVDATTFFLGSGLAGLAGVAVTLIGSIGSQVGAGYIIDAFLVVIVGGLGKLRGTIIAAFGLGVLNAYSELWTSASLGKAIVFLAVIAFLQFRPNGLVFTSWSRSEGAIERKNRTIQC